MTHYILGASAFVGWVSMAISQHICGLHSHLPTCELALRLAKCKNYSAQNGCLTGIFPYSIQDERSLIVQI